MSIYYTYYIFYIDENSHVDGHVTAKEKKGNKKYKYYFKLAYICNVEKRDKTQLHIQYIRFLNLAHNKAKE